MKVVVAVGATAVAIAVALFLLLGDKAESPTETTPAVPSSDSPTR